MTTSAKACRPPAGRDLAVGQVAGSRPKRSRSFLSFFFWTTAFYPVDVVASFAAVIGQLTRGPHAPPRA